MLRSVYDVQRDFALTCGLRSQIVWDSLGADQSEILKEKIRILVPESNGSNRRQRNAIEKLRNRLYENVWSQRKYTNRTLLSAIIYVLVTKEKQPDLALQSTQFSCHPVFRTRKCLSENNSVGCCMVFIDENGRIYNNWKHYLKNNILPKGTMIAPANGFYTITDNDDVALEIHVTPAARTKSQIISTTDTVAASVGGAALAVPVVAALTIPVAGALLTAATAITVSTAAYTAVRSVMHLNDRSTHGQTLALTDREARNDWLGVAGGVMGLGASGATKFVKYASNAGQEISLVSKVAIGINVSSALLSGTGLVNGVYDLYMKIHDNEEIDRLDFVQFASSLLVFTHSINNIAMVSQLSTRSRGLTVRRELGFQMRRMLNRLSRDTLRFGTSTSRVSDIIRTVNDIPQSGALTNLQSINSNVASTLGGLLSRNIAGVNGGDLIVAMWQWGEEFGARFVQHITNPNSLLDVLAAMGQYMCIPVVRFFLNLTKTFIEECVDVLERTLSTFISTESVLHRMLMQCIENYSNFSYEFLESKTGEILTGIERFFNSLNPIDNENVRHQCKMCNGYFYVCTL